MAAPNSYRDVFAPMSECLRHPDQLVEEFADSLDVRLVEQVSSGIEQRLRAGKVAIPKNRHQAELPEDGNQILDHARATKATRRYTANAHSLVYVLFQIRIEYVLKDSRIAVVVLWNDQHQSIRSADCLGECSFLDRLAGVISSELQIE